MEIIRAERIHTNEIISLVAALISELTGGRIAINEVEAAEFIERAAASGKYLAFLARDNNQKAFGLITLGESGAVYAGGEFGVIHEFFIVPGKRCNGAGKKLLEKAKETAINLGWKRLEVGAPPDPEWRRTKHFYLKEGFFEIGPRLKWLIRPEP